MKSTADKHVIDGSVEIRDMVDSDRDSVCQLILDLFDEFIGPGYSERGCRRFHRGTHKQVRRDYWQEGGFRKLAFSDGELIGVIGVRDNTHVHWLWVRRDWHRRGVARLLMRIAVDTILLRTPQADRLTLNASPYAVEAYKRLGFRAAGHEHINKGIVSTPMIMELVAEADQSEDPVATVDSPNRASR